MAGTTDKKQVAATQPDENLNDANLETDLEVAQIQYNIMMKNFKEQQNPPNLLTDRSK